MSLTLVFLHGWGFDAGFWARVIALLPGHACRAEDRGYFGAPTTAEAAGPVMVIGHSLGAMRALAKPPRLCAGLVAINGFDRFADSGDGLGTPRRVLDRMLARLADDPTRVVADFRQRCGSGEPFAEPQVDALRDDLALLRDGDCRDAAALAGFPILALHGSCDPLLSLPLRENAFSGAKEIEHRALAEGGHLLPWSHPDWCAARIAEFAGRLA